jgi:hypothetical protein
MNTIYLIGVVVIGIVILFYCHCKRGGINIKQINPEPLKEVIPETTKEIKPEILFCYHSKSDGINKNQIIPKIAKKIIPKIPKEIKPEMPTKNKFLYPTDEFGKMEKGVIYDSNTYVYELNENNRNDLVILSEKKLVKQKKYRR